MLPAVHAAQLVLTLLCVRLVLQKLRQLRPPPSSGRGPAPATADAAAAIQRRDVDALAAVLERDDLTDYQLDMVDAAVDALAGDGDVGAFVHTAALDARQRTLAGVRLIRGMATLAGTVGLLGAMAHHFAWIHGRHERSVQAMALAEQGATQGALLSMGLGLGTAIFLYAAARVIRGRVLTRLREITAFNDALEVASKPQQQWTKAAER